MSEPDSPLDPRDLQLLRALRDGEAPAPEVRARVLARIAASAPALPPHGPGGHGPSAHAGWTSSVLGKGVLVTAALLVGGAGGAGLYAELRPTPPARVIYVPQPIVVPGPPLPPAAASHTPVPPAPSAVASVSHPAASFSSRTAQLDAERLLLDEARAALVQGEPERALDRLERHRRTFAAPVLGEERDAMEVEALAKAGRGAEARAKADAFRRRWPDSLFLPAVETAVESIP